MQSGSLTITKKKPKTHFIFSFQSHSGIGKPEHERNSCWRCLLVCQECRALREEDAAFVRAPVIALVQTSAPVLSRGREKPSVALLFRGEKLLASVNLGPSPYVVASLRGGCRPSLLSPPLPLRRVMQSASNPSREALFDARYSQDAAGVCNA